MVHTLPLRREVKIRHPLSISQEIPTMGVNVSRAEKLPLSPGYYFLMMPNISPVPRGPTFQHLNRCPGWTGKDEPYWIMPPCATRRGRDFSYACREEVEDDGAPRP